MSREATLGALRADLEEIYRGRPENLAERMSTSQRELAKLRDELRMAGRNGGDSTRLNLVNQALSLLHGAAYPGAAIDWEQLRRASELLAERD